MKALQRSILLLSGAILLLTGCGKDNDPVDPTDPDTGNINMNNLSVNEVKAAIGQALVAGITEFKLTGPIANSGIDGSFNGSPFYNTQITKIDLTEVTGWTAVNCDGNTQTIDTEMGLPAYAFLDCAKLTEVKLPAGVKAIGAQAFSGCTSLTTINLEYVTHIGRGGFSGCTALSSIALPEATTLYSETFSNAGLKSVSLPKVTSISEGASNDGMSNGSFCRCEQLTAVNAPLLTNIGLSTFLGCIKLETVDIPKATTIGQSAFSRCESLKSIDFDKVTTIGENAFVLCTAATEIKLPLATTIGSNTFRSCTAVTEIELPVATSIDSRAFLDCTKLKTLRLPAATELGNYIVAGCSNLTWIEVTTTGKLTGIGGGLLSNSGVFDNNGNTNPPFNAANCALVLHTDKQPGGSGEPVTSGNTWISYTWKNITYQ